MTIIIKLRLPSATLPAGEAAATPAAGGAAPAASTGPREVLRTLLPIVEPAALLLAEAAGAGLLGQVVCATMLRTARQALGA